MYSTWMTRSWITWRQWRPSRRKASRRRGDAFFGKHGFRGAHHARVRAVVPAALGLDADGNEYVGVVLVAQRVETWSACAGVPAKKTTAPSARVRCRVVEAPQIPWGGQRTHRRGIPGSVCADERSSSEVVRPAVASVTASRKRRSVRQHLLERAISFEPQLDTTTGCLALSINCRAAAIAAARSTGLPFCMACSARGRSKICARSRPLLQIHGPFTAGFSSGVMRSMLTFLRGSSALSFHSDLRCQIWIVQPRAQPGQTDGVGFRYQTRAL